MENEKKYSILILGCGAIGSNLAANLVADLKGKHQITVLDKDVVEEHNVTPGTQFYTPDQVGQPKVEALQFNIYKQFQREIKTVYQEIGYSKWPQENDNGEPLEFDLAIDCLDNHISRKSVQGNWGHSSPSYPRLKNPYELLHIGFSDQFTFAIEWAEHYQVPTDITTGFDICEMPGARAFVASVAALGSLVAQKWIDDKEKMEIVGGKYTHTLIK